jgi:hypothetical protein
VTAPDTVGGAFVQALAPDQYPAYEQRIAEIGDRVAGAASGPWRTEVLADGDGGAYVGVVAASGMCVLPPLDVDPGDVEFIAAARSDVPALLAEVGRLRAALSEATDHVAEQDAEIGRWSARVAELEAQAAARTPTMPRHDFVCFAEDITGGAS